MTKYLWLSLHNINHYRKWSIYSRSSRIALVILSLTFWIQVPPWAPAFGHGLQKLSLFTRTVLGSFCANWVWDLGAGTEFWPSFTKNAFWEGLDITRTMYKYCHNCLICVQYTIPRGKIKGKLVPQSTWGPKKRLQVHYFLPGFRWVSLLEEVTDAGYMEVQPKLCYVSLPARANLENRLWLCLLFPEHNSVNGKNEDSNKFVASE